MASLRLSWHGMMCIFAVLIMTSARADEPLVSLTENFLLAVLSPDDSVSDEQLRNLAKERARSLIENVAFQTDLVRRVAIPDSIVTQMDAPLLPYTETYVELEGHLTTTFFEYDDLSNAKYLTLQPANGSGPVFLHFDGPPPNVPLGRLVRVRGILLPKLDDGIDGTRSHMVLGADGNGLEVLSDGSVITAPSSVGRQRTAIFLGSFSDDPASLGINLGYTRKYTRSRLAKMLRRQSFGAAWVLTAGAEHIKLATTRTCDRERIQHVLFQTLAFSGKEIAAYDRIFLILPSLDCNWRTATVFPGSPNVVLANEMPTAKSLFAALLHGLGVLGYQVPPCDFDIIYNECQDRIPPEWKEPSEIEVIGINPYHKESVGWMGISDTGRLSTAESGGMYRIWATNASNDERRPLALRIERSAPLLQGDTSYYVEYRVRRLGGKRLPPEVVIHIVGGYGVAATLNLTSPGPVPNELRDAISLSEDRFIDHAAGLDIEVVELSASSVDLDISFDPTSCVRASPEIELASSDTPYLSPGSSIQLSMAVTNRDSSDCEPLRPRLHLAVPNGWSVEQDAEMPILQPGQTVERDVSVTIPSDEGAGFHQLDWIVQGDAPIPARRSTMLFVMPSRAGSRSSLLPATYNDFVGVGNCSGCYSTLKEAVDACEPYIFLREGRHKVSNPITIDCEGPLIIHGFAIEKTSVVGNNLNKPLFIVERTPFLSVQRIQFFPAGSKRGSTNQIGFDFQNTTATRAEFAQLDFKWLMPANIKGPGDFALQNVNFNGQNMLQAGIIVDHPGASMWYVNGHIVGDGLCEHMLQDQTREIYHIWQKRGHVELYNLLTVAARGDGADFRFDTRSPKGAHVVAGVRSEGVRNIQYPPAGQECASSSWRKGSAHQRANMYSHLIYVPPTTAKVDILVMANFMDAAFDLQDPTPSLREAPEVIRYNGAGTVWALSNNARYHTSLISGNAQQATIVAAGNLLMTPKVMNIDANGLISAGNLQNRAVHCEHANVSCSPPIAHIESTRSLGSVPLPPARGPIPVVETPRVDQLHPFMELKSVKSFGAKGDGTTDDTAALQRAINEAGDRLFFPAGTYHTTKQLALHYDPAALGRNEPGSLASHGWQGGWWAGAGQEKTTIRNSAGGRVFISGGMGRWQIQDMTFETADNSADNVSIQRQTNSQHFNHMTTMVTISNSTFIGGKTGLAWAADWGITGGNINTEGMLCVGCTFRNAIVGVRNGRWNAFGNTVFNSSFINNKAGYASVEAEGSVMQSEFIGNDMDIERLAWVKKHYFARNESDSPIIWEQTGPFRIDHYLVLFDTNKWTGLRSNQVAIRNDFGGGATLLHSSMTNGLIFLSDRFANLKKYAISLGSQVGQWNASKAQSGQTSGMYVSDN